MTLEDAQGCIKEDERYCTVRVEEPDLIKYNPNPLLQFLLPSFSGKTLIRKNLCMGLDREKKPSFSVNKLYFTKGDKPRCERMMRVLQRRNCKTSAEWVRHEIAKR